MTYRRGGLIEAATFNDFADIVNKVYGDTYQSGVTPAAEINYGYGAAPMVTHVVVGNLVTAANWTSLFSIITLCGLHLGVSTSPIPASVSTGQLIEAYNDYLTEQTLHEVIGRLVANRFLTTPGQLSISSLGSASYSTPWTTGVTYAFSLTFSSANNARYFFNSGGNIRISGSYAPPVSGATSVDFFWRDQLLGMNTVLFALQGAFQANTGQVSNFGFYDLLGSYQEVYRRSPVSEYVYYSNDFISIYGLLSGNSIQMSIRLFDNDNGVQPKAGTLSFNIGKTQSSGAIPFSGSTVFASLGFSPTVNQPYVGPKLNIIPIPETAIGTIDGPGTIVSNSISIRATGGVKSHPSCYVATVAPLSNSPTYSISSSIGLLTATSNGALVVDGITISATDANGAPTRILVKNQATSANNGLYEVVDTGGPSSPYQLARGADMPQYVPGGTSIQTKTTWQGNYSFIQAGTYASTNMQITTANPTQVGVTGQAWAVYPGLGPYTYSWTSLSGDSVTINSPSAMSSTLSKSLSSGQIAQGQVQCTVTDINSATSVTAIIPWALTSNNLNS